MDAHEHALLAWVTRRARYGPSGLTEDHRKRSDETRARMSVSARARYVRFRNARSQREHRARQRAGEPEQVVRQ